MVQIGNQVKLSIVRSIQDIRLNVKTFSIDTDTHTERAQNLARQTRYWVYDKGNDRFAPSKFVGFKAMNFQDYEASVSKLSIGANFNGNTTRKGIEDVIGYSYFEDESLSKNLVSWGIKTFGYDVFKHTDQSKWKFIILAKTENESRKPWNADEIIATVRSYFSMFIKEIRDEKYNKTEYRRLLLEKLQGRTEQAIEFKHCNIGAVLRDMGLPYIEGYKPRGNYQHDLYSNISVYLENNPDLITLLESKSDNAPEELSNLAIDYDIEPVSPPKLTKSINGKTDQKRKFIARPNYDFIGREARNKKLGIKGEEFVLNWERNRLSKAERPDLAERVEWTSKEKGDGAGYDILSFEVDGTFRYIEVKTTNYGKSTRFLISKNEIDFADLNPENYYLYRVFNFSKKPSLFILSGNIRNKCNLTTKVYEGSF